jgi:hypothetical protein
VEAETGVLVSVAVRPEALQLEGGDHRGRAPPLAGSICNIERLGSETLLHVAHEQLAVPLVARVDPAGAGNLSLQRQVALTATAVGVSVFDGEGRRLARRPAQPVRLAEIAHG